MPGTREIYWNVGQDPELLVSMYALAFLGVAVLCCGFWLRVRRYRKSRPLKRSGSANRRLWRALQNVLLQSKVTRKSPAGIAHALLFWSFSVLCLGTFLIFVQSDLTDPLFHYRFLQGAFYRIFSLSLDLTGLTAIIALLSLFFLRYRSRPEAPAATREAVLLHGTLLFILLTGFLVEGVRIAATELRDDPQLSYWSPVGLLVARSLPHAGDPALRDLHRLAWWVHLGAAAALIAIVPFTRMRHVFTICANYFFGVLDPPGSLSDLDLKTPADAAEDGESVVGFSWKDLLDCDACTDCLRCQDSCPAFLTGKPLSPRKVISRIGEAAFSGGAGSLCHSVPPEEAWSCTTCRACQEVCPADIEHVGKIVEIRRDLVLMGGKTSPEMTQMFRNLEFFGDPSGMGSARRSEWAQGLAIAQPTAGGPAHLLYWVGCAGAFDERYREAARSLVSIFQAAREEFCILGPKELCCGDFARRMGNEYLYQDLAGRNIETFSKLGIKKLVTSCPHCFNVFKNEYPSLGSEVEVMHHSQYLLELLRQERLTVAGRAERSVTYHDSCYLGRYNGIYQEPREILLRLPGVTVVEPERGREKAFCCGGGGGFMWLPEQGERINETRAAELLALPSEIIATACPYCRYMVEEGIAAKAEELGKTAQTLDLAEIIAGLI